MAEPPAPHQAPVRRHPHIARRAAREAFAFLVRWSGIPSLIRATYARHKVSILLYHDPPAGVLDRHLRYLARHHAFVTLAEFVSARAEGRRLPPKSLIVTIDDGHSGNARLLPVFRKYGVVPTVYVCTQIVGTHRHFWWTEVEHAEPLKRLPDARRLEALTQATGFSPTRAYDDSHPQALSIEELHKLATVAEIGSHTRFHPILPQCEREQSRSEIEGSKTDLESLLGRACAHFSYPNGEYTARDRALVESAGYASARTTTPGWNDNSTDLFAMKVIGAPDDASINRLVAAGATMFVKHVLASLRELRLVRRRAADDRGEGAND